MTTGRSLSGSKRGPEPRTGMEREEGGGTVFLWVGGHFCWLMGVVVWVGWVGSDGLGWLDLVFGSLGACVKV